MYKNEILKKVIILIEDKIRNQKSNDMFYTKENDDKKDLESNMRFWATQGMEKARSYVKNKIYFELQKLEDIVNEKSINSIIESYLINYFENIFIGSNKIYTCVNEVSSTKTLGADHEICLYFQKFSIKHEDDFDDKLLKLAQIVYQELFGFGVIDELVFDGELNEVACNRWNYIWIQYKGIKRKIPNKDFTFENEAIYNNFVESRFTSTGKNEMNSGEPVINSVLLNGTRVTSLRTPVSRYFSVNFRIFNKNRGEKNYHDALIGKRLSKILNILACKGRRNVAIIGEQGSGKTTAADELIISQLDDSVSIGLAENVHELDIGRRHPGKNVIELQYSNNFKPSDITEIFFRLNRDIVIFGEVRSPEEAFEMIKAMLRQARGSLFTFHSSSVHRMIHDLRQLLMQSENYSDFRVAQFDVADAVDLAIHIKLDRKTGERFIYKVSEILAKEKEMSFEIRDLYIYNKEIGKYGINKFGISKELITSCLEYEMSESDLKNINELFEVFGEDKDGFYIMEDNF